MDTALWAVRMAGIQGGAILAAKGYGDEALWEGVTGVLALAVSTAWSWCARRQALKAAPK